MNEILKKLYDSFNTDTNDKNPFKTRKFRRLFDSFIEQHFKDDIADEAYGQLEELCELCQMRAFEIGFFTALGLFLR